MDKVLFIGCGLISGSFLLNVKNMYEVNVVDINENTLNLLRNEHNIKCSNNVEDFDLSTYKYVFIGLYPLTNKKYILEHLSLFENTCVVDFAGIQNIWSDQVDLLRKYNIKYIATHPMSGREVSGFESALVNLFVGKNIVINNISADSEQVDHISSLYVKCGGNVINDIDCVRHDEIVTYTSQLPHVISLAYTKRINEDENKDIALISSNSFNEFSRISNINEKLWTEVFCDNAEMLVGEIDELIANLNNVKKLIAQRDKSGLDEYLIDSKNKINSVNKNKLS